MKSSIKNHLVNIILPSVVLSALVGALTGAIVFLFRLVSEEVIKLSALIFTFAGANLWAVPLVVLGAVLIALCVSFCIRISPHARGGGIPTAVALMRGLITFRWLRNLIFVFVSALFSYLCGIPLGNDEGPAVQMGTAVGSGTTRLLTKRHRGWERYLMTSGATAGFATATCAPVAAVMFGLEEAHRRITPLLLMSSTTSVIAGMGVLHLLCHLTGHGELTRLFHFPSMGALPLSTIWTVIPIAVLCGVGAYLLAKLTRVLRGFSHKKLHHVHHFFKTAPVFAVVALLGCFFYQHHLIGTGHHLIEHLIEQREVWWMALILLLVRALLMVISNEVGATGGLFTPLLVFGALIGSLCAEAMIAFGWLDPAYFLLMVVVGMAAFFSASVRTPITAMIFSIEVFGGFENILPILLAVGIAYGIVESVGVTSINEIAMEREIHREHRGKTRKAVDVELTVQSDAFAIGKEPRDILWPPYCHVLSVRKGGDVKDSYEAAAIREQDILRLNFTTLDEEATARELCAILGDQDVYANAHITEANAPPQKKK